MADARFIGDSSGEVSENPAFELAVLGWAETRWYEGEAERAETAKRLVRESRALKGAEVRLAKGLLLEAGPMDPDAYDDASLIELPTGVYKIVTAGSTDSGRMERLDRERQKRKETEAERKRREEMEDRRRKREAFRSALDRLNPRRTGFDR